MLLSLEKPNIEFGQCPLGSSLKSYQWPENLSNANIKQNLTLSVSQTLGILDVSNVVVFQSPSYVRLFAIPWTAVRQASLSLIISWSLPKFMSIESVMSSNHLYSAALFSFCLRSFPASGSFPMSLLFISGGQSIEVSTSASVLPMNIQG